MNNEELEISYQFPTLRKRNSTFINLGVTYSPLNSPHSGYSADSRFFAKSSADDPQYIVKRVLKQKIDFFGDTPANRAALFASEAKEFESELKKWNTVYPNKKGTIVLDQENGPRLILPCLPGRELGSWLNELEFDDKLTEAKIWLAVAYALRDLATKNLYQNDILEPNILVHNDGKSFKAYIIDFGGVSNCDYNVGRSRICQHAQSITGHICKDYDQAIDNLNSYIDSLAANKENEVSVLKVNQS
ncbi:hypothetical protein Lsan_2657 [Legionella santicrucis]|uniref:Protein kinase domain-containing protein n=1 Tax=Legionella santicrucis TaxID=45074 RepID=A0A0W0YJP2_9GAMM|nr:serine/threonine protein kinase [Legionella santicrucis]KTD57035.1 hypothetical protein Lsan_2657 [Legionella santicrucis]